MPSAPKPATEVQIVAASALSAAGASVGCAVASARLGLSRITFASDMDVDDDRGVRVARADYLAGRDDISRIDELLSAAVRAVVARLPAGRGVAGIPISVVVPRSRPGLPIDHGKRIEMVARDAAGGFASTVTVVQGDGAAGLAAVSAAAAGLRSGRAELALVVAVDSLVSDDAMDAIEEGGRLHRADHPWGLVPGEGAAGLLLATRAIARSLSLPPLCGVRSAGTGSQSPAAPPGSALTDAVLQAVGVLPAETAVEFVFADINGERGRSDAWAFASVRLGARLHPTVKELVPAMVWGDAGAASGLLLLSYAAGAAAAGWFAGPALIWSADGATAASLLVDAPAGADRGALVPEASRAVAHVAHDRALLREALDEGAALVEQRRYRIELEETAPLPDWTGPAAVESRIDRVLDALAIGGDLTASVAAGTLSDPDPAKVHVAARTLAATADARALSTAIAQACLLDPRCADAAAQGVLHAMSGRAPADLFAQLSVDERGLPTAMAFAWRAGVPVSSTVVARAARFSPEQIGTALPRAVARGGRAADMPYLQAWLSSEDTELKQAAMLAMIRHSGRACEPFLGDQATAPWIVGPLALLATPACADLLLSLERRHGALPAYAQALGLLGDLGAVPILIRLLSDPAVGASAATALVLISGADPRETVEELDVEPDESLSEGERAARRAGDSTAGVTRRVVTRASRNADTWQAFWRENRRRFEARVRHRMGLPLGREADARALAHPGFPPTLRRWLADAVALAHGTSLAFDIDLPVDQQRRAIQRLHERRNP